MAPPSAWNVRLGLEIHAQLSTQFKLFSGSRVLFGKAPNSQISLFDAGYPGTLPTLNLECVNRTVLAAIGLNSHVNPVCRFDRKHYFYSDMPLGYQITQEKNPIATGGYVILDSGCKIQLERLQLEQDSGKSIHELGNTFIDLNRAGTALVEIVTKPELDSADQAIELLQKVSGIFKAIGVCDAIMAEGSLRCDVNVSLHQSDEIDGSTARSKRSGRVEIKNLNSYKAIIKAVDYEYIRQLEILDRGGQIEMETRMWDPSSGTTVNMRSKEVHLDYRFMPDPDIQPLRISKYTISQLRETLPELPSSKRMRYQKEYGLTPYQAKLLVDDNTSLVYFDRMLSSLSSRNGPQAWSWLFNELKGRLGTDGIERSTVSSSQLATLVCTVESGAISGKVGKQVLDLMVAGDNRAPLSIAKEQKWLQVEDTEALRIACIAAVNDNPKQVQEFLSGRTARLNFLVGSVLRSLPGDPVSVKKIMFEELQKLTLSK